MQHYALARFAVSAPVDGSRSLSEVTEAIRAAATGVNAVAALCAVLTEKIGNPDLEDAINAIRRIYDAEPQAHYEAAADLGRAALDACDYHCIE